MTIKRITCVNNVTGKVWTSDQPENKVDKVIEERVKSGEFGIEGEYTITIEDVTLAFEDALQKTNNRLIEKEALRSKLLLANPVNLKDKELTDYIQVMRDFILR